MFGIGSPLNFNVARLHSSVGRVPEKIDCYFYFSEGSLFGREFQPQNGRTTLFSVRHRKSEQPFSLRLFRGTLTTTNWDGASP